MLSCLTSTHWLEYKCNICETSGMNHTGLAVFGIFQIVRPVVVTRTKYEKVRV